MKIKQRLTYLFDGQEFGAVNQIEAYIENTVGKIIDSIDVTLTPNQKLKIFDALELNHKRLYDLLSTSTKPDYDQLTGEYSFDE